MISGIFFPKMMRKIAHPWQQHYDPGIPFSLEYPDAPLQSILENAAQVKRGGGAIIYRERSYSFSQIDVLSTNFASHLLAKDVVKGDRVGLLLANTPEFVISFFGVLKAGGIVVAINPKYKENEIRFILEDSGIRGMIFTSDQREICERYAREGLIDFGVFCSGNLEEAPAFTPISRVDSFFQAVLNPGCATSFPEVVGDDPAVFQYSGGTTGVPKAAIGLHRNILANVLQFKTWLKDVNSEEISFLSAIPFYHVYGMVLAMCLPIEMRCPQVLVESPQSVVEIINVMDRYKPSIFPCVPNLFRALLTAGGNEKLRKSSLRICISGSAPLEAEVRENFEKITGAKILEGFGLSEAPTATHCNPVGGESKPGSIGMPLPDVDCRIVDMETGEREMKQGEEGELILCGPQVMQGYFNRPGETDLTLRGGWLYTGDIARMDEDGYFYLTGRKKELIKVGGFQVWPQEVESVIREFPGVCDVAVAGICDPETGERPKAWIIPVPNINLDLQKLEEYCHTRLADYKVPHEFEAVREFPRTPVGKILRRELVRLDGEKKHPG